MPMMKKPPSRQKSSDSASIFDFEAHDKGFFTSVKAMTSSHDSNSASNTKLAAQLNNVPKKRSKQVRKGKKTSTNTSISSSSTTSKVSSVRESSESIDDQRELAESTQNKTRKEDRKPNPSRVKPRNAEVPNDESSFIGKQSDTQKRQNRPFREESRTKGANEEYISTNTKESGSVIRTKDGSRMRDMSRNREDGSIPKNSRPNRDTSQKREQSHDNGQTHHRVRDISRTRNPRRDGDESCISERKVNRDKVRLDPSCTSSDDQVSQGREDCTTKVKKRDDTTTPQQKKQSRVTETNKTCEQKHDKTIKRPKEASIKRDVNQSRNERSNMNTKELNKTSSDHHKQKPREQDFDKAPDRIRDQSRDRGTGQHRRDSNNSVNIEQNRSRDTSLPRDRSHNRDTSRTRGQIRDRDASQQRRGSDKSANIEQNRSRDTSPLRDRSHNRDTSRTRGQIRDRDASQPQGKNRVMDSSRSRQKLRVEDAASMKERHDAKKASRTVATNVDGIESKVRREKPIDDSSFMTGIQKEKNIKEKKAPHNDLVTSSSTHRVNLTEKDEPNNRTYKEDNDPPTGIVRERGRDRTKRDGNSQGVEKQKSRQPSLQANRRDFSRTRDERHRDSILSALQRMTDTDGDFGRMKGSSKSVAPPSTKSINLTKPKEDKLDNFMRGKSSTLGRASGSMSVASSGSKMIKRRQAMTKVDDKRAINAPKTRDDDIIDSCSDSCPQASDSDEESIDEHMQRLMERREANRNRPAGAVRSRSLSRTRGIPRNNSTSSATEIMRRRNSSRSSSDVKRNMHSSEPKGILKKESSKRSINNTDSLEEKKSTIRRGSCDSKSLSQSDFADEIVSDEEAEFQTSKFLSFLKFANTSLNKVSIAQPMLNSNVTGINRLIEAIGYRKTPKGSAESCCSDDGSLMDFSTDKSGPQPELKGNSLHSSTQTEKQRNLNGKGSIKVETEESSFIAKAPIRRPSFTQTPTDFVQNVATRTLSRTLSKKSLVGGGQGKNEDFESEYDREKVNSSSKPIEDAPKVTFRERLRRTSSNDFAIFKSP